MEQWDPDCKLCGQDLQELVLPQLVGARGVSRLLHSLSCVGDCRGIYGHGALLQAVTWMRPSLARSELGGLVGPVGGGRFACRFWVSGVGWFCARHLVGQNRNDPRQDLRPPGRAGLGRARIEEVRHGSATVISALPCRTRMCKSRSRPAFDGHVRGMRQYVMLSPSSRAAWRPEVQPGPEGERRREGRRLPAGRRGRKWQRDLRQACGKVVVTSRLSPKTALASWWCCLGGH